MYLGTGWVLSSMCEVHPPYKVWNFFFCYLRGSTPLVVLPAPVSTVVAEQFVDPYQWVANQSTADVVYYIISYRPPSDHQWEEACLS